MESALQTLTAGGLFGAGPGAGIRKFQLPEPHTDYIFSVIGEEFGIIACLAIAILYMTIVVRVLVRLLDEEDKFLVLATAGLVCQFGLQALINMAVNVHIAPSKGMTLPFISYGGSSMIALAIGFGLLLAFSRRNPHLQPKRSRRDAERDQMSIISRHYVLAAGGTGGHMIPAHALAEELLLRGHRVALITDDRGARIPGLFDKVQVHILPAGRLSGGPLGWFRAGQNILTGRAMALRLYETFLPSAVIGFGGYPALSGPARGAARRHSDPDPRAECGARPGQPADGGQGRCDRHRL